VEIMAYKPHTATDPLRVLAEIQSAMEKFIEDLRPVIEAMTAACLEIVKAIQSFIEAWLKLQPVQATLIAVWETLLYHRRCRLYWRLRRWRIPDRMAWFLVDRCPECYLP